MEIIFPLHPPPLLNQHLNTDKLLLTTMNFNHYSIFRNEESINSTSWTESPLDSLRTFHTSRRLPPIISNLEPTTNNKYHTSLELTIYKILYLYTSPLLFSSDSSHEPSTKTTVTTSVLLALNRSPLRPPSTWPTLPPIPFIVRTHYLPQTIGTSQVDNNMGEIQGLILSLQQAPLFHPSLFLIDSKQTFDHLLHFFFPLEQTNRKHLKDNMPSASTYYTSSLYHNLTIHFPPLQHNQSYPDPFPPIHSRTVNDSYHDTVSTITAHYKTAHKHAIDTSNFNSQEFLDSLNKGVLPTDKYNFVTDWTK